MAPAVLDETGFDRFVSDNDTAVIGFVGEDRDAAAFSELAGGVLGKRPGVAFAQVHGSTAADRVVLNSPESQPARPLPAGPTLRRLPCRAPQPCPMPARRTSPPRPSPR